jgi:uncharacterized membrane protein
MAKIKRGFIVPHAQRYILTGVLVLAPLWVTWLVFQFLFTQLYRIGRPWVVGLSRSVQPVAPELASFLLEPGFEAAIAVVVTVAGLYLLGWGATKVMGKRLIAGFERVMERIPLAQAIYGATKKVLAAFQKKPDQLQRVVLINFPSAEMKTVGFLTRILKDATAGQELAAVYVPTAPNPTSGYMEIMPLDQVIPTDWTIDEAMSFIITGGTTGPDKIHYTRGINSERAAT